WPTIKFRESPEPLLLPYRLRCRIQRDWCGECDVIAPLLAKCALRAFGPEAPGDALLVICSWLPLYERGGRHKGCERRMQRLSAHDLCVRIDPYHQGDETVVTRHGLESLDIPSIGDPDLAI